MLNNLYSNGFIIDFGDGTLTLNREPVELSENNYSVYYVQVDDTLPNIAYRLYGDDSLWYIIADVNNIYNPFDIKVGDKLIIPDKQRYL